MGGFGTSNPKDAIAASWDRCARQYKLLSDTGRPILRLQTSEVTPRLEQIVERTGGRQGFFQSLASVAGEIGHCLVVTDADGVLVRLEHSGSRDSLDGWNGIALGSCWNEQVAGTNGVSMALQTGQAFTVRGADHFFSKLRQFACTGVPMLDANGVVIGAINLVSVDRGHRADYMFSQQLLEKTANRIQRNLFEREFNEAMLVTVSRSGSQNVLSDDALVAVDDTGVVLGATSTIANFLENGTTQNLIGQSFEAVFNVDSGMLVKVPERVLSMPGNRGAALNLSVTLPGTAGPKRPARPVAENAPRQRRLPPSLQQLATGSRSMAAACRHAQEVFTNAAVLHLEGETGTGKSALVAALLDKHAQGAAVFDLDCATLGDSEADKDHLRRLLEQARVLSTLPAAENEGAALVLDNVDELSGSAQAEIRRFLDAQEEERLRQGALPPEHRLRIVSTCRKPLIEAVYSGRFRDDLYYLLTAARIVLPPLRQREHPEVLAQAVCAQITGRTIELSEEAKEALRSLPFHGNVRELRGILQNALMSCQNSRITLLDLQQAGGFAPLSGPVNATPARSMSPVPVYDERTMILDALAGNRWNVSAAARVLGMGRATLNRKLKTYKIRRPA
ncbi:sigma-54-dependent Fis family transcriptional regulator [Neptunicoccus cionae]|uniref:sigma-54-dependent Fis family transcriptional regulator n=1 Tax=Neptunicoccus cionae TaxID=2035344 RepID=UPI000C77D90F|nr:sigma 54-interacting transcriptional regulator [Amylibacter cionae]PLS21196.1 hypothetical protein C0U40_13715 [Amylibacter cionae]